VETQLTGMMDEELITELQRIAQRFLGKQVKVVVQEWNGQEKKPRQGKE
jgi:hypothetical protein